MRLFYFCVVFGGYWKSSSTPASAISLLLTPCQQTTPFSFFVYEQTLDFGYDIVTAKEDTFGFLFRFLTLPNIMIGGDIPITASLMYASLGDDIPITASLMYAHFTLLSPTKGVAYVYGWLIEIVMVRLPSLPQRDKIIAASCFK